MATMRTRFFLASSVAALAAASLPAHAAYVAESQPALAKAAFALRDRLAVTGDATSFAAAVGVEAVAGDAVAVPTVVVPAPEPETYAMMLVGLGALGWAARRRRSS